MRIVKLNNCEESIIPNYIQINGKTSFISDNRVMKIQATFMQYASNEMLHKYYKYSSIITPLNQICINSL